jgi:peptide deformylase
MRQDRENEKRNQSCRRPCQRQIDVTGRSASYIRARAYLAAPPSRCFQHETDHLHGTVFGDRLSTRRRRGLYQSHRQVADRYSSDWPTTSGQS